MVNEIQIGQLVTGGSETKDDLFPISNSTMLPYQQNSSYCNLWLSDDENTESLLFLVLVRCSNMKQEEAQRRQRKSR